MTLSFIVLTAREQIGLLTFLCVHFYSKPLTKLEFLSIKVNG